MSNKKITTHTGPNPNIGGALIGTKPSGYRTPEEKRREEERKRKG